MEKSRYSCYVKFSGSLTLNINHDQRLFFFQYNFTTLSSDLEKTLTGENKYFLKLRDTEKFGADNFFSGFYRWGYRCYLSGNITWWGPRTCLVKVKTGSACGL